MKEIYKDEETDNVEEKSEIDDLLADVEVNDSINVEKNPLLDLIVGTGFQGGPVLAQFNLKDKELVNEYLSNSKVRQLLPPSKRYTKFLWGLPDSETNIIDLYVL